MIKNLSFLKINVSIPDKGSSYELEYSIGSPKQNNFLAGCHGMPKKIKEKSFLELMEEFYCNKNVIQGYCLNKMNFKVKNIEDNDGNAISLEDYMKIVKGEKTN